MSEGFSLINLGDLAKPATIFVEKACNAAGVLYEPIRTILQAHAEGKAEQIRASARAMIADREQLAMLGFSAREARRQEVVQQIAAQAAKMLKDEATPERVDDDWLANVFNHCDSISDSEMQILWAKILATEATMPGSFSKNTVNVAANLDKTDATLFTALGQFCWDMENHIPSSLSLALKTRYVPVVFNYLDRMYRDQGIDFDALKHLDAIGLISYESRLYSLNNPPEQVDISYFGQRHMIGVPRGRDLVTGRVWLTSAGQQLVTICGANANPDFVLYTLDIWRKAGLIIQPSPA